MYQMLFTDHRQTIMHEYDSRWGGCIFKGPLTVQPAGYHNLKVCNFPLSYCSSSLPACILLTSLHFRKLPEYTSNLTTQRPSSTSGSSALTIQSSLIQFKIMTVFLSIQSLCWATLSRYNWPAHVSNPSRVAWLHFCEFFNMATFVSIK